MCMRGVYLLRFMNIISGLQNGMVMQQTNGVCDITFYAESKGEIISSAGKVATLGQCKFSLTGIEVGGSYSLTLQDDESTITLTDLYVGDVYLLAGQSNMQGVGTICAEQEDYNKNPNSMIRAYYMDERWGVATHHLHQPWLSVYPYVSQKFKEENLTRFVGPGVYFANQMFNKKNVPIGLIPCAVGGTDLTEWKNDGTENLYYAMKSRFIQCGSHVAGVLWFQGENEAGRGASNEFVDNMVKLVGDIRKDFGLENLPFVQAQINKCTTAPKEQDAEWNNVREYQRTLDMYVSNIQTVYSNDSDLDDVIHLSSASQKKMGKRFADAMWYLQTGNGKPSPQLDGIEFIYEHTFNPDFVTIKVKYKNVIGRLKSNGVANGYAITDNINGNKVRGIFSVRLENDYVLIKTEITKQKIKDCYLNFAIDNDFYCNITDGNDRCLPAFSNLKISNYL